MTPHLTTHSYSDVLVIGRLTVKKRNLFHSQFLTQFDIPDLTNRRNDSFQGGIVVMRMRVCKADEQAGGNG